MYWSNLPSFVIFLIKKKIKSTLIFQYDAHCILCLNSAAIYKAADSLRRREEPGFKENNQDFLRSSC